MKACLNCATQFDSLQWKCSACGYTPPKEQGYLVFAPNIAQTVGGFEETSFAFLVQVEEGSFWFQARNKLLVHILRRFFPDMGCFFEVGCGTGFVLATLGAVFPQVALTGSDLFVEALPFARSRVPLATLFQMDARKIPFADEFDVIGLFDVLEHVLEDETVLGQLFQAVKPGGGIVLTVPQHPILWSVIDDYSGHVRRYTCKDLSRKVRQAGFEVAYVTSFVSLLLPLMFLSPSRKKRKSREQFNPMDEYRMSRKLNFLLKRSMDVERFLIQRGVTFPCGGSLLFVARRPKR